MWSFFLVKKHLVLNFKLFIHLFHQGWNLWDNDLLVLDLSWNLYQFVVELIYDYSIFVLQMPVTQKIISKWHHQLLIYVGDLVIKKVFLMVAFKLQIIKFILNLIHCLPRTLRHPWLNFWFPQILQAFPRSDYV